MSLTQIYLKSLHPLVRCRLRLIMLIGVNILLAAAAVLEPILFGRIIDEISGGSSEFRTLLFWIGFALCSTIAHVVVARASDRLAHTCRADILSRSFASFVAMPVPWHHKRGPSVVFQTLIRACESLFGIWLEFLRSHLGTFIALAMLVPTALWSHPLLGSVLIGLGAAYWWIGKVVMARTKNGQNAVERHYHNVFLHMSDTIGNVSVLHSFNRVQIEAGLLRRYIDDLLNAQFPVLDWWALANALNRMAATISMTAIILLGSVLVRRGELSVGDVVTFIGFATMMIGRLDQVRGFVNQVFEARPKLEEFLELQEEAASARDADKAPALAFRRGKVEFQNVSFEFDGGCGGVRNISFAVEPGQTVAVIGPTGAGKTTLVNLLQRHYDPQAGRILIDDVDIATVSKTSVREQIAIVLQEAGLLNRSIASNIRLGREHASDEEIKAAAIAASADEFIIRRPGGYEALVGDKGSQLSGGERQRIAIARAILKSAPILVLDEATSALDVETEAVVKDAIQRIAHGRTTFIIAHRLSTIRDADLVLVMKDGRIVEHGSYKALAQKSGHFSRLLEVSGIAA